MPMRFVFPQAISLPSRWFGLGRTVRALTFRHRPLSSRDVPFGWVALIDVDTTGRRDTTLVTPLWVGWPILAWRSRWRVYALAVRIGLARVPYEGCYFHELIWFPDMPKFAP